MRSKTCPFCDIIQNKSEIILIQNKYCFAVFSNPRLVPGHLLVIPKKHAERINKLTKKERDALFDTAIKLQDKILDKIATGCDLTQHYRPFIKQDKLKVNHLHIHLRPRDFEDELYHKVQRYEKKIFKNLTGKEFSKFKKLLFNE